MTHEISKDQFFRILDLAEGIAQAEVEDEDTSFFSGGEVARDMGLGLDSNPYDRRRAIAAHGLWVKGWCDRDMVIKTTPICPYCGDPDEGPHAKCSKEVDTIKAPAAAPAGDYVWFYYRAKELGYHMAVMPADE